MNWLSKQPSWREAREVQISTRSFGLRGEVVTVPGEAIDASALVNHSRPLTYLPSSTSSHVLWYPPDAPWYQRRRVSVTRVQRNKGGYFGGTEESLELRILARSHTVLNRLLLDAKRTHVADQENKISIYVANKCVPVPSACVYVLLTARCSNDMWRYVASRPKRALTSIVLDPGVTLGLIQQVTGTQFITLPPLQRSMSATISKTAACILLFEMLMLKCSYCHGYAISVLIFPRFFRIFPRPPRLVSSKSWTSARARAWHMASMCWLPRHSPRTRHHHVADAPSARPHHVPTF